MIKLCRLQNRLRNLDQSPLLSLFLKPAPKAVVDWKDTVKKLLEQLRPSLQADGGDLELVDIENDGTVSIRLQGHCAGCPYSYYDS